MSLNSMCKREFGAADGGRPHQGVALLRYGRRSIAMLGSRNVEPVVGGVGQQNEVNHRCQKEEENPLRHENATWIENQPDLVELAHVSFPLRTTDARRTRLRAR
jgi:hypothetical protein